MFVSIEEHATSCLLHTSGRSEFGVRRTEDVPMRAESASVFFRILRMTLETEP